MTRNAAETPSINGNIGELIGKRYKRLDKQLYTKESVVTEYVTMPTWK